MNQAALKNVRASRVDWNVVGRLEHSVHVANMLRSLTAPCSDQYQHTAQPNTDVKLSVL